MRTLPIAVVAATLTIPSAGYSQDQGLVGGKVGPNLEIVLGGATGARLLRREPLWRSPSRAAGTPWVRGRGLARPGRE